MIWEDLDKFRLDVLKFKYIALPRTAQLRQGVNPLHDCGFASMYIMAAAKHANLRKLDELFLDLHLFWRQETLYTG